MRFEKDETFEREVESFYGKYLTTFHSERDQVRVDLFQDSGFLVAYVSFAENLTPESAGDPYVTHLSQYAKKEGFDGKLRLVMSGST